MTLNEETKPYWKKKSLHILIMRLDQIEFVTLAIKMI